MSEFWDLLQTQSELLAKLEVDETMQKAIASYLDHLWKANRELNLVSRKMTVDELVLDHVFDCLIAFPHLPTYGVAADLGSGGGMPGALLAICRPHQEIHLYEKSPLKCKFLRSCLSFAPNLVVQGPIPQQGDLQADWITARAFKSFRTILQLTGEHWRKGRPYYLYKGRLEKIEEEINQAPKELDRDILPLTSVGKFKERHLLICKKPRPK